MLITLTQCITRTGQVITRPTASVMKFRAADQDSVEIAGLLDVDAILEGNFQKSGNRLRLTAQLLDSETGKTLWAESFNTEIDDIFEVQDRIAERIVNAFSKQHSAEASDRLTKRYTENKAAYQEYLKGRVNFSKRTADGLTEAPDVTASARAQQWLERWVKESLSRERTAQQLRDELADELRKAQSAMPLKDDQTFLIVAENQFDDAGNG